MDLSKKFLAFGLAFLTTAGAVQAQTAAGGAQGRGAQAPPPPPQNLQVLPKDIPRPQLQSMMQGFDFALGVNCSYCHVTEPTRDLASDAKPTKKVARLMIEMTSHINEMIGSGVGKVAADVTQVQCATCHRGKAIPETPVPPPPQPRAAEQAPR